MAFENLDFGDGVKTNISNPPANTTDTSSDNSWNQNSTPVGEDKTALDGNPNKVDINNIEESSVKASKENNSESSDANSSTTSSTGGLSEGDKLEFDGTTYTVDKEGNLVDDKGTIFKSKDELKDWLDTVDEDTSDDNSFSINSIQDKIGVTVTDEAGKPVEFTNDAEGVASYVNSVLNIKSEEISNATMNKFFNDNPYVKQFIDYVQLTGSPQGFGNIPDRSGIVIDKDNVQQQEAIIRMAATEFGNKSINDNYIKYLKDSGSLYDEANNQLEALIAKDKEYMQNMQQRAEEMRRQEEQELTNYWNKVNDVIASRTIAGYKLPNSFIKERNGQKVTVTPNDFYEYLSRQVDVDANGNGITAYQRDLNQLSDEETLNRDLLSAWLVFTGGSYKDLVDMAINEEKVKKLKLKSSEQRAAKTVKIIKANKGKVDLNDIIL